MASQDGFRATCMVSTHMVAGAIDEAICRVRQVDAPRACSLYAALCQAIQLGLVSACDDRSDGGLGWLSLRWPLPAAWACTFTFVLCRVRLTSYVTIPCSMRRQPVASSSPCHRRSVRPSVKPYTAMPLER